MKWQAAVAAALASAVVAFMASAMAPSVASAEVRIADDPGGEVSSYVQKFQQLRASGERIVNVASESSGL